MGGARALAGRRLAAHLAGQPGQSGGGQHTERVGCRGGLARAEVAFIEPFSVNKMSNFDAAHPLQSGYKDTANEAGDEKQVSARTTLWNHGVRG